MQQSAVEAQVLARVWKAHEGASACRYGVATSIRAGRQHDGRGPSTAEVRNRREEWRHQLAGSRI